MLNLIAVGQPDQIVGGDVKINAQKFEDRNRRLTNALLIMSICAQCKPKRRADFLLRYAFFKAKLFQSFSHTKYFNTKCIEPS